MDFLNHDARVLAEAECRHLSQMEESIRRSDERFGIIPYCFTSRRLSPPYGPLYRGLRGGAVA